MGLYRRGKRWWIDCHWRGIPRLQLSTRSTQTTRARAMLRTLESLRDAGRRDVLALLAQGRLDLADVHEAWLREPAVLAQCVARAASPSLGPLVDEWLAWLKTPAAVSPRTRRTYARRTVQRYWQSWQRFFRVLPKGKESTLADLTRGFCSAYREARRKEGRTGATVNRDMVALSSFLRWCEDERSLAVLRFRLLREQEGRGRERWLSADEIANLERAAPGKGWPLYATLLHTGLRVGEAQGLRWQDVRLAERRIIVRERAGRRLKTATSERDVPITEPLARVLTEHAERVSTGPNEMVFPGPLGDWRRAYRRFRTAAKRAGLHGVTVHDLRHTFGVHCAQSGVPLPRLQKLMGHASPVMTMRYMQHAPESYFAEDAARVAASLTGEQARERSARSSLVRATLGRGPAKARARVPTKLPTVRMRSSRRRAAGVEEVEAAE